MNRRTVTRLEKLEGKAPAKSIYGKRGYLLDMTVDDNDPAKDEKIAAFRRDNDMAADEMLIVRVIVDPPFRPA
ncbi:MAG: hypothetical protein EXQ82_00475 [Pseudolabrys sp.]|nr:hypothetical protein [Pseudolabrys sp.]